jgi:hypothetical protein
LHKATTWALHEATTWALHEATTWALHEATTWALHEAAVALHRVAVALTWVTWAFRKAVWAFHKVMGGRGAPVRISGAFTWAAGIFVLVVPAPTLVSGVLVATTPAVVLAMTLLSDRVQVLPVHLWGHVPLEYFHGIDRHLDHFVDRQRNRPQSRLRVHQCLCRCWHRRWCRCRC